MEDAKEYKCEPQRDLYHKERLEQAEEHIVRLILGTTHYTALECLTKALHQIRFCRRNLDGNFFYRGLGE